jgi:very-short-patch-repair endonuclease
MSRYVWTKEEEELLIKIYSDERNDNISKLMNIDIDKIKRKASSLNLKKSKEQKSRNIASRNKLVGRDLSFENLKEIAKNYKTRGEFQRLDGSAYTVARIAGYLEDICSHMVVGSYSIPQLTLLYILKKLFVDSYIEYNCKNIIKPYEIDIYISEYKIGFEYDGKLWHLENKLDAVKDEMCKNENITLIRLKENNRRYSEDIKNQLIENIDVINNFCNKNFKEEDIMNVDENDINDFINDEIVDDNSIIEIISKYTNYHDFKINEVSLYNKLRHRKILEKFTSHLIKDRVFLTEEFVKNEISKYDNLSDFIEKSNPSYNYIKRNSLEHLLSGLTKKYNTYTVSDLKNEISKYTYLKDFRENCRLSYEHIIKNNLNYLIKDLKRTPHSKPKISISELISEIEKYEYLVDFRNNSFKYYSFVKKHNLSDLIIDLKRNKPLYTISEIKNEIDKYEYLKDFREQSNGYYRYIQYHKLTDMIEYSRKLKEYNRT